MHYGADLNAQDNEGDTPLNVMIDFLWSREPNWLRNVLFARYGKLIDPKVKNKKGQTL